MAKMCVHICPESVLIGPKNKDNWRVGVSIRAEAKELLTNRDKADIGTYILTKLLARMEPVEPKSKIVIAQTIPITRKVKK